MPTVFVTGDLFSESGLDALAHGCNCAGAMGKGIAVEFRRRFPEMYVEYRRRCREGAFGLGDVLVWKEEHLTIFNLATQRTWRTKAELWAIEHALACMVEKAQAAGVRRVGLPRIGAGLGGLVWATEVKPVISKAGNEATIELVVFENFVKADPKAPGHIQVL